MLWNKTTNMIWFMENSFVLLIYSMLSHLGYEGVDDNSETFVIKKQFIWSSVCLLICFTANKQGQTHLTSVSGNVIKQNAQNLTLTIYFIILISNLLQWFLTDQMFYDCSAEQWPELTVALVTTLFTDLDGNGGCCSSDVLWLLCNVQDLLPMAPLVDDTSVSRL